MPEDVDAVFHVAGDVSLWSGHKQRQWGTNVEGTRNMVATALAKRSRKFVHTSSTAVYGIPAEPFDETSPKLGKDSSITNTRRPWRRTKLQTGLCRDWMRSF